MPAATKPRTATRGWRAPKKRTRSGPMPGRPNLHSRDLADPLRTVRQSGGVVRPTGSMNLGAFGKTRNRRFLGDRKRQPYLRSRTKEIEAMPLPGARRCRANRAAGARMTPRRPRTPLPILSSLRGVSR